MRVAIFITSVSVGGAEMQVYRILSNLKGTNIKPIVISMRPFDEVGALIESLGVKVYSLDMKTGLSYFTGTVRLYRILKDFQPEVLSTFLYHANILGRFVGHMAGVPRIISSIRNIHFGGKMREWMVKNTDGLVDCSVVNSRLAAERMVEDGLLKEEKVRVIVNGIDPSCFFKREGSERMVLRAKLGLQADDFIWIAVGRFDPQKNHLGLLGNFYRVVKERPEAQLLLAGDGPLRAECEAYANVAGIGSHVHFLGIRDDVADLLSISDAYVLSSLWEGLPNVVMEASCAELPTVAMEVGGVAELVEDKITGLLVREPDKLGDRMIELMALEPAELRRMGLSARSHLVENYSIQTIAKRWEDFYCEIGE